MLGDGDADPQESDSLGAGAGDAIEAEGDPVVGLFEGVFKVRAYAAEPDDEAVGLAPGGVGRVGLSVELDVGDRGLAIGGEERSLGWCFGE